MTRERKIEAILADAFREEGFEVADGMATLWIDGDDGGKDVTIDIARIAHEVDIELDRIMESKK